MTDPEPYPSLANPSTEDLKFRLTRLDHQIGFEHDIIGHRMSWLKISQSFLFSAFAISLSPGKIPLALEARTLQHLVPVVGLASALTVGLALLAGHQVVRRVQRDRDQLEQIAFARGLETFGTRVTRWNYTSGDLPSKVLPWIL